MRFRPARPQEGLLTTLAVGLPLVLALLAAPLTALAGSLDHRLTVPVSVGSALAAFLAVVWGWGVMGGGSIDLPWSPTWNLRLAFELDGLGALYAMLATGIGACVVFYSSKYLALHLEHQGRSPAEATKFHALILMFMGSMVGLVTAQDLFLIFVFWDLTAIASYFLIGYDVHERESRYSALMAMLVTGVTAVLLLVGAVMLYVRYGTFLLPELEQVVQPGPHLTVAAALIAVAGLAKSAQVPFHFWLPRAMAAPTPVSAYLHSAAMVAAGVFLIGRVYPLIQTSQLLLDALIVIGFSSMVVGGVLALSRDVLKQLLAYSTISQYGYVVFMFGLGGSYGVAAASFYVLAHALVKSALFLTAGTVTEATGGEYRLSKLGGLAGKMPVLAAASGVAAAGLGALPLTIGFFKDELLFAASLERGGVFPFMALLGAVLTLSYMWRFWSGVFLGSTAQETVKSVVKPPAVMVAPIVLLGVLTLGGGVFVGPFVGLANAAAGVSFGEAVSVEAAYHLDTRPENLLAGATFALAALVVVTRRFWSGAAEGFAKVGELAGPERLYAASLHGMNNVSDSVHDIEVDTLRSRVSAILIPAALLVGAGFLASVPSGGSVYSVGGVRGVDLPLLLVLLLVAAAAVAVTIPRNHLTLVLVMGSVGFGLAVVYAFLGAPDVALVAVLVEIMLTLLFLGILALMPKEVLERTEKASLNRASRLRAYSIGVVSGLFALFVVWGALSQPAPPESIADEHIRLTPDAHGYDIVTVILADFRGLDTLGEIMVIGIAVIGISALLLRGRLR
ncbi:hydrogen gas-evolving membrane-bound hydrogenase subunit E [Rubrobacter indicoceani]|uniref:hydrogen gas-evolving membrane-bound hydrogenase subunit E n=1 Tax=Rubrobacter indicoceani TaxID=2051957 RepID=UPI001F0A00F2|nr:hydrogen gas-evolving membrane-bound hydrogenase subunit E [Rubrobacter indicoceani]